MSKKIDDKEYLRRNLNIHGTKYEYLDQYVGANTKLKIKCKKCKFIFMQRPADHWSGHGCPNCAHKKIIKEKKLDHNSFLEKCRKSHKTPLMFEYLTTYTNSRAKMKIKCLECNNIFEQKAINHYRGQGCPNCSKKKNPMTNNEFLKKAKAIHENTFEYLSEYEKGKHIRIQCKKCQHEFKQLPGNHLSGHGCPNCKKLNAGITQVMTHDEFLKRSYKIHGNSFEYLTKYTRSKTKIKIKCQYCQSIFEQRPNNHLQGQGCPNCSKNGFNFDKPATLYYIYDPQEDLYKIGITNKTIEERFGKEFCSNRAIAILEQKHDKGIDAYQDEQEILKNFDYARCINNSWPKYLGGSTEFFKWNILGLEKEEI